MICPGGFALDHFKLATLQKIDKRTTANTLI
jgi:hypothetical protein